MIGVEVSAKNFKSICLMLGYRRQKVRIIPTESVRLTNLNWDSGTKNTYHACDLTTGVIRSGAHLGQPTRGTTRTKALALRFPRTWW